MSKNIIFYFTGTGNSLKISKDVANIIGDCKISSILAYNESENLENYEKIGFICPVYGLSIPNLVYEFISKINLPKGKYYFCIITYADNPFASVEVIQKLLNKKNIKLNNGFTVQMVNNYYSEEKSPVNYKEIIQNAQIQIKDIGQKIKDMENKKIFKNNPFTLFSCFRNNLYKTLDKHFIISEKCIGCGICQKLCPAKNITIENNRPKFNNNCELCVVCIHSCPKRAIDFYNKSKNRKRYINPEIKWEEIYNTKAIMDDINCDI
jgi:ferredoxin